MTLPVDLSFSRAELRGGHGVPVAQAQGAGTMEEAAAPASAKQPNTV